MQLTRARLQEIFDGDYIENRREQAALASAALASLDADARIAGLKRVMRRLSFAAQTSGGTAGRDDELVAAIEESARVLAHSGSPGGAERCPNCKGAGGFWYGKPRDEQRKCRYCDGSGYASDTTRATTGERVMDNHGHRWPTGGSCPKCGGMGELHGGDGTPTCPKCEGSGSATDPAPTVAEALEKNHLTGTDMVARLANLAKQGFSADPEHVDEIEQQIRRALTAPQGLPEVVTEDQVLNEDGPPFNRVHARMYSAGWNACREAALAQSGPSIPPGWRLVPSRCTEKWAESFERVVDNEQHGTVIDQVLAAAPTPDSEEG